MSKATKSQHGDATGYDQNPALQEQPLRELLHQRGWELRRFYTDRASGAKEGRPGLDALMDDARRSAFNAVVVWRFDRFARSVKHLVLALEEFRSLEIDFVSHQEPLDTSTPIGKAMFTIIGAMAELERNVIRGRVAAGLKYARAHGTKSGKPAGRPRRVFDHKLVSDLPGEGKSPRQIAAQLGLGEGTVRRVLRTESASAQPRQNLSAAVV